MVNPWAMNAVFIWARGMCIYDPAGRVEPHLICPHLVCTFPAWMTSTGARRYPYIGVDVRRNGVDVAAKVTSKGQVTVPKVVRDALGIRDGDQVIFRVEGNRAVLARTPNFLDLAGTVSVPASKRNVAWDAVIRRTRSARAAARR